MKTSFLEILPVRAISSMDEESQELSETGLSLEESNGMMEKKD